MCMLNIFADQTQNFFWVFYMFLKVILYFHVSSFCSTCILVFFIKNWFRGCFARSSLLRASREMCLREIKSYFSYRNSRYCLAGISWLTFSWEMVFRQKLDFSQNHTETFVTVSRPFATISFSRKHLCFSDPFHDYFATSSLLPNLRKMHVFSLNIAVVTCFQTFFISLA